MSPVDAGAPPVAVIFGLASYTPSREETAFFRDTNPLGFILFARNIQDPAQVRALTQDLKNLMGRNVPVLIDQEGGPVARLRPPHWPVWPAARRAGEIADQDLAEGVRSAAQVNGAIAATLRDLGIGVNCAPVLDVVFPETHDAIGDRAYSADPQIVSALGSAVCAAHLAEGVIPVVKHMPGQGRAAMDSHLDLPVVSTPLSALETEDFVPFRHINQQKFARSVWGMVSHVVYADIDPGHPATCSPAVVKQIVRGSLDFDGFLLSDDIVMNALGRYGDMGSRAALALGAGCDTVLHCNGVMSEMKSVAEAAAPMTKNAISRFNASLSAQMQAV